MPKIIAVIIELLVFICALWVISFLSSFLHELGHAIGYMLATGDRHWHIRVGWGKRLLNSKALNVNLLVFDGFFTPLGKKINTKKKTNHDSSGRSRRFFASGRRTFVFEIRWTVLSIRFFC